MASLAKQRGVTLRVIVVDNGSEPAIASDLEQMANLSGAVYLRSDTNLGYAGGMNVGLRIVASPIAILANNDLVFEPDAVQLLVRELRDPSVGLASPRVEDAEGTESAEWGRFLTPVRALARLLFFDMLFERFKLTNRGSGDWLAGPCFAFRTPNLLDLGGVPQRSFMYSEDMRLCHGITRRGMSVRVASRALIRHEDGAASRIRWSDRTILRRQTAAYLLASQDFAGSFSWLITASFRFRTFIRYLRRPGVQNASILAGAWRGPGND